MQRPIWLAAILITVAGGSAYAQAIQSSCPYYFPIRATGAACSGPGAISITGTSACCVAAPRGSSYNVPNMPPGGNRYAAGLALSVAGLALVVELINLFGPAIVSAAEPEAPDYRGRLAGERADAIQQARRWHAAAMREVQKGDMRSAEGFLFKAVKLAEDAADYQLRHQYQLQLDTVLATKHMMEGLAFQAEGNLEEARVHMAVAGGYARRAGQVQLAQRIEAYRKQIVARMQNASPSKRRETGTCMTVNGSLVCE